MALHAVLAAALADPRLSPAVRDVITKWSERDPVKASADANLLKRAFENPNGVDLAAPDIRRPARVVHGEWSGWRTAEENLPDANRLAEILDAWADALLAELIRNGARLAPSPLR